ncbi:hypothetical protein DPEC_G00148990 [Dallia pectoralis]|uniref:Uncharacterized protein n=1 Tax=Dallia pectoralis TaxID=75939 RepID=A0ACC2GJ72_DALPE|nr:hypothetical protein DPEC_G00148990 [Dallia pectoralis]
MTSPFTLVSDTHARPGYLRRGKLLSRHSPPFEQFRGDQSVYPVRLKTGCTFITPRPVISARDAEQGFVGHPQSHFQELQTLTSLPSFVDKTHPPSRISRAWRWRFHRLPWLPGVCGKWLSCHCISIEVPEAPSSGDGPLFAGVTVSAVSTRRRITLTVAQFGGGVSQRLSPDGD